VKLAGWLLFLALTAALAQTPGQNGIRIGAQTVYFTAPLAGDSNILAAAAQLNAARARATGLLAPAVAPTTPTPRADFETWVEGINREYSESVSPGVADVRREAGKVTIERYVRDNFRHLYIAYSITVELFPGDLSYRAAFGDSHAAPPRLDAGWTMPSPRYPAPQLVLNGDTIPLDLYINGTQKLVDYIHFGKLPPVLRRDPPRDVYTDAPEFDITEPRLRFNGVARNLDAPPAPEHGQALWIYIPGQGRFDLSFKAGPDFEPAGQSLGTSLTIASGRDLLRLESSERIAAAGSAPYRVYVKRNPEWTPPDPADRQRAIVGVQ
jgi:hypothetical protein